MEKDSFIMEVECKVVLIADSIHVKGHVDIVLDPVDKTIFNPSNGDNCPPPMLVKSKNTPFGNIGMMMEMAMPPKIKKMMGAEEDEEDPRLIKLIEDKIDFASRDWQYGDTIVASFKKKKMR